MGPIGCHGSLRLVAVACMVAALVLSGCGAPGSGSASPTPTPRGSDGVTTPVSGFTPLSAWTNLPEGDQLADQAMQRVCDLTTHRELLVIRSGLAYGFQTYHPAYDGQTCSGKSPKVLGSAGSLRVLSPWTPGPADYSVASPSVERVCDVTVHRSATLTRSPTAYGFNDYALSYDGGVC